MRSWKWGQKQDTGEIYIFLEDSCNTNMNEEDRKKETKDTIKIIDFVEKYSSEFLPELRKASELAPNVAHIKIVDQWYKITDNEFTKIYEKIKAKNEQHNH